MYHSNHLLSLHEGDAPYIIRVLADGNLETVGRQTYEGALNHAFTAHPKVDPETGEGKQKERMDFLYSVEIMLQLHQLRKKFVCQPIWQSLRML